MSKKLLANVGNAVADNYRRYYQEYEGTFITATDKSEDDTLDTSRYIEVTEIWGNTVQDENNLEDIQSVGELYVDDEGNPILDVLGREQYKIEIESCNGNLSNINYVIGYIDANHPLDTDFRFSISLSDLTEYIPPQSNKTTILLPCQLQKVGNVYDRLYWDSEKGKYVVEKNIIEYHITNLSIKNNPEVTENVARIDLLSRENIGMTNVKNGGRVIVSNSLKERTYYTDRTSVDCQYTFNNDAGASWIGFVLPPQFNTNSLFINELVDKNTRFLCQVNIPQLIETNITEKILLPCYSEKTHIFVNSTVDASMKVLVPYKEII